VLDVASGATPMAAIATRAVKDFLMESPQKPDWLVHALKTDPDA
jgi:hypothetical protein